MKSIFSALFLVIGMLAMVAGICDVLAGMWSFGSFGFALLPFIAVLIWFGWNMSGIGSNLIRGGQGDYPPVVRSAIIPPWDTTRPPWSVVRNAAARHWSAAPVHGSTGSPRTGWLTTNGQKWASAS
jgi:hypothetical protein